MYHATRGWLARHKRKIGLLAVGHTAKRTEEMLFDWILYGIVTTWATAQWGTALGSLVAFSILTPIAGILCLTYLIFYDWAKVDWLGLELIKEWRDEVKHEHWFGRLLHRITRWGAVPAFIILSMHSDAFVTTAYFRPKHRQYDGLTARDWAIFAGSLVTSNAYWTLRWVVIIELARLIFSLFIQ